MVRNLPANAGDIGLIPGSGGSPGERNSNPFQYSCLGNSIDRGAWQAIVHGGCKRVRHDLVTKQQQQFHSFVKYCYAVCHMSANTLGTEDIGLS